MVASPRYALVAYLKNPVGEFVEQLRRELHPHLPHLAAHLTVLPPRSIPDEASAIAMLQQICAETEPFEVHLGEVETFIPVTPTVFIRVAHAHRMLELHNRLSASAILAGQEEWPYLPHLTIAKMSTEAEAQNGYLLARRHWAEFEGSRSVELSGLTFVREARENHWLDLAEVPLGPRLVSPHSR